jgi:hypothetical protein
MRALFGNRVRASHTRCDIGGKASSGESRDGNASDKLSELVLLPHPSLLA